jgi:hypothetical protein
MLNRHLAEARRSAPIVRAKFNSAAGQTGGFWKIPMRPHSNLQPLAHHHPFFLFSLKYLMSIH